MPLQRPCSHENSEFGIAADGTSGRRPMLRNSQAIAAWTRSVRRLSIWVRLKQRHDDLRNDDESPKSAMVSRT